MKKLSSSFTNMVLSLGAITAIAGALLGAVYSITKEPIEHQAELERVEAIKQVAPQFNNNPQQEATDVTIDGNTFTVYPAMLNGKFNGAAVKAISMNGFAGEIVVMAGFEADGTLKDYRVIQQAETPGLGTKMEMWFRDPVGARSIIGKNPATTPLYVTKDTEKRGEVDAITAATISSRAFLESIRNAYEAYRQIAEKNAGNKIPESL